MQKDYPLNFVARLVIRISLYFLAMAVTMVATLESLHVNIQQYVNHQFLIMSLDSDPMSNPLFPIGFLSIIMMIFISWDMLTEKYLSYEEWVNLHYYELITLKGEIEAYEETMKDAQIDKMERR